MGLTRPVGGPSGGIGAGQRWSYARTMLRRTSGLWWTIATVVSACTLSACSTAFSALGADAGDTGGTGGAPSSGGASNTGGVPATSGGTAGSTPISGAGASGASGTGAVEAGTSCSGPTKSVCVDCCKELHADAVADYSAFSYGCACSDCYSLCAVTLCDSQTPSPSIECITCMRDHRGSAGCGPDACTGACGELWNCVETCFL